MNDNLLEMSGITKQFYGVYALKEARFELKSGELHALLGENGAGKSTLMKILGGIYSLDAGTISINGKKVKINGVKEAKQYGISIIHQEIVLVPYLSITENIYLGREPLVKTGFIDKQSMYRNAQKLLDDFGMELTADTLIHDLTVAQQQMVEIIKAVSFNSKIIIMDEPTSSISEKEVRFLFKTIQNLKQQGVGIVYISHRINELFEISDRITVMRDGSYIDTVVTKETTNDKLISMMVGRELSNYYIKDSSPAEEEVLEVKNLTRNGSFQNISFTLRKGEILGFSGLVGAGRSELMKCIFGLDFYEKGDIIVNGHNVRIKNPSDAIKNKIVYITENRKEEGLFLLQSVRFNMTIEILNEFMRFFRVNAKYESKETNQYINGLSIKTSGVEQEVKNLSGGNQQKVMISKWLAAKPQVLIMDEPTRGVDVGAKAEIYMIMNKLAKQGVSIIMVSSDLPEVINMSDRVAVMCKGKIQTILKKDQFSQETIMHYATGGQ
jgi:ABC-type sugar transport system ATPase subunit